MEVYMPPYSDNDSLGRKISKIIDGRTNMNPPASKTVELINLLVRKIEELETKIIKLEKLFERPNNENFCSCKKPWNVSGMCIVCKKSIKID